VCDSETRFPSVSVSFNEEKEQEIMFGFTHLGTSPSSPDSDFRPRNLGVERHRTPHFAS
jgi:hypothetical protein